MKAITQTDENKANPFEEVPGLLMILNASVRAMETASQAGD